MKLKPFKGLLRDPASHGRLIYLGYEPADDSWDATEQGYPGCPSHHPLDGLYDEVRIQLCP